MARRQRCDSRGRAQPLAFLHPRHPGAVDREHRKGEVLDEGVQRPENARGGRYPDRGHRWSEGMSEALAVVYPATTLQTCIVRLMRNSLDYASWKERKCAGRGDQARSTRRPVPRALRLS